MRNNHLDGVHDKMNKLARPRRKVATPTGLAGQVRPRSGAQAPEEAHRPPRGKRPPEALILGIIIEPTRE